MHLERCDFTLMCYNKFFTADNLVTSLTRLFVHRQFFRGTILQFFVRKIVFKSASGSNKIKLFYIHFLYIYRYPYHIIFLSNVAAFEKADSNLRRVKIHVSPPLYMTDISD